VDLCGFRTRGVRRSFVSRYGSWGGLGGELFRRSLLVLGHVAGIVAQHEHAALALPAIDGRVRHAMPDKEKPDRGHEKHPPRIPANQHFTDFRQPSRTRFARVSKLDRTPLSEPSPWPEEQAWDETCRSVPVRSAAAHKSWIPGEPATGVEPTTSGLGSRPFCGSAGGYAQGFGTRPSDRIRLEGSTFGAVRITGDPLPTPVTTCPRP